MGQTIFSQLLPTEKGNECREEHDREWEGDVSVLTTEPLDPAMPEASSSMQLGLFEHGLKPHVIPQSFSPWYHPYLFQLLTLPVWVCEKLPERNGAWSK